MLLAASAMAATPSAAVVGGERTSPQRYPWLALEGQCGATLVAPDRLVTAAHCVAGTPLRSMEWKLGGRPVTISGVAAHPRFEAGEAPPYDVAIMLLAAPVDTKPVALARPPLAGAKGTVLGTGAPAPKAVADNVLRRAALTGMSDRACASWFRRHGGRTYRRAFDADTMLCASAPKRSACRGDSGGPWFVAGRLAGVVSWGKDCKGPSVFADPAALRSFIEDPAPLLKPVSGDAPPRIEGEAKVGATLRCVVPAWKRAPKRATVRWSSYRFPSGSRSAGRGETLTVAAEEEGRLLSCSATGSNASGSETTLPSAQVRVSAR